MKVSCCIDMMFSYCDFYERLGEVKKCGIDTVEFWKWSDKNVKKIAASDMNVSIFNIDSRDEKLSYDLSRGILNDGRRNDFLHALNESISVYKKLDAKGMIVLIGENSPYDEQNVYSCLAAAKPIAEKEKITLLIEPLNDKDRKNYSMPYSKPVFELLKKLNSPNIKMLYDIYHQNMMNDFSIESIRENIDLIGHFHVADAPGRHEPGTGKINYIDVLSEINKMPYSGFIGLEYRATKKDSETLGFLKEVQYV